MKHWFAVVCVLVLAGCQTTSELVLPVSSSVAAETAPVGTEVGNKLHDFAFVTEEGKKSSISDYRGKVVFVNFWASWCRPCRDEMPAMNTLFNGVGQRDDVAFILLQVNEAIEKSRAYLADQGYGMLAMDTGHTKSKGWGRELMTRDGELQRYSFVSTGTLPTSYILDKRGVISYKARKRLDWHQFEQPMQRLLAADPS